MRISIIAVMLLSACGPHIVTNDGGGVLFDRLVHIAKLDSDGRQVRIIGNCDSACTMYLRLPDTCVAPDARLGFHSASASSDGLQALGNAILANQYPPNLRKRFEETYSHIHETTYLTGLEVHQLDGVPLCA